MNVELTLAERRDTCPRSGGPGHAGHSDTAALGRGRMRSVGKDGYGCWTHHNRFVPRISAGRDCKPTDIGNLAFFHTEAIRDNWNLAVVREHMD